MIELKRYPENVEFSSLRKRKEVLKTLPPPTMLRLCWLLGFEDEVSRMEGVSCCHSCDRLRTLTTASRQAAEGEARGGHPGLSHHSPSGAFTS